MNTYEHGWWRSGGSCLMAGRADAPRHPVVLLTRLCIGWFVAHCIVLSAFVSPSLSNSLVLSLSLSPLPSHPFPHNLRTLKI